MKITLIVLSCDLSFFNPSRSSRFKTILIFTIKNPADESGGTHAACEKGLEYRQCFVGEIYGERPLGRPRRRWEKNMNGA